MTSINAAVARELLAAELYAKELLPNPDYDDGGQNKGDRPLVMAMIDYVVGNDDKTSLAQMRHNACQLMGLLGQVAMELCATWVVGDGQQSDIAQGLVANAATEMAMQVGDDATGVRSQLCLHLSRKVDGVDLQSSLMYGYSTAVQPVSAIVQAFGSLGGSFAKEVD